MCIREGSSSTSAARYGGDGDDGDGGCRNSEESESDVRQCASNKRMCAFAGNVSIYCVRGCGGKERRLEISGEKRRKGDSRFNRRAR